MEENTYVGDKLIKLKAINLHIFYINVNNLDLGVNAYKTTQLCMSLK